MNSQSNRGNSDKMTELQHPQNSRCCGLFQVCRGQYLLKVVKRTTGDQGSRAKGSPLHGNCISWDVTLTCTTYIPQHTLLATVFSECQGPFLSRIMHPATVQTLFRNCVKYALVPDIGGLVESRPRWVTFVGMRVGYNTTIVSQIQSSGRNR